MVIRSHQGINKAESEYIPHQRTGVSLNFGDFLTAPVSYELESALVFVESAEHPGSAGCSPADRRRCELAVLGRRVVLVPRDPAVMKA